MSIYNYISPNSELVNNHNGGKSYKMDKWDILQSFLILGSEQNTYHVGNIELTVENSQNLISCCKENVEAVVGEILSVLISNRAVKKDPSIFALAMCCKYGKGKHVVYDAVRQAFKTSTDLFMFLSFVQSLDVKWCSGLRKAVSYFYESRTIDEIGYQVAKYVSRNGFTHVDAIRLAHPNQPAVKFLFGKAYSPKILQDKSEVMHAETLRQIISVLDKSELTWEMIPTDVLAKYPALWSYIIFDSDNNIRIGDVALLRNLNRYVDHLGVIEINRLALYISTKKFSVHPFVLYTYAKTYASGHGVLGNKTWTPNKVVVTALNEAVNKRLKECAGNRSEKKVLCVLDVSGSMQSKVTPAMSAFDAESLMAGILYEKYTTDFLAFSDKVISFDHPSQITTSVPFGSTNPDLIFNLLDQYKPKYDAIIFFTDSEISNRNYPAARMEKYRNMVNKDAKMIVCNMVANGLSIAPTSKNSLAIVGLDANLANLVENFIG